MEIIYVIPTTHWDREWYRTFNDFRIRLCDVVDSLIDILDKDPDFKCFTFDGQTVVLEDYLHIYPENEEKIKKYVNQGRISIGPFYIIPDEFIPSGESTIRNLLIGDEICKRFGKKLLCGYLPDNFGHTSQMPQILKGFNIDNALFFRGMEKDVAQKSELYWESPDGTRILCEYLLLGYWNLKSWGRLGMDTVGHFKEVWKTLKRYASTRFYLMLNGADHLYPEPYVSTMIKEIKRSIPDIEIINGSIEDFMNSVKKEVVEEDLKIVKGELRYGRDAILNPSVLSTRLYVKQENHRCERELEKYCEPMCTLMYIEGEKYRENLINKSWRELIKNQAHDSVSGCSSDEVMRDVMARYTHSHEISSRLFDIAFGELCNEVNFKSMEDGEKCLMVYNPLGWVRNDLVEGSVSFPLGDGIRDIRIYDPEGREIPYELLEVEDKIELKEFKYNSKEKHVVRVFRIRFMAQEVPPIGYKAYRIRPFKLRDKRAYQQYEMTVNLDSKIENDYYTVRPNPDGTISVCDKRNGFTYQRLNLFEDRGDYGDEYQYAAPYVDEARYPVLAGISVIHNTPLQSTLKMTLNLIVPEGMDAKGFKRSGKEAKCPITTYITLYRGIRRIDFKTVVENNAGDHILTVKFPTDIKSDSDYAYCPFDIIRRDVDIPNVRDEDNEVLSPFKPVQCFVNVHDEKGSLTMANKGIYEYQVKRSDQGLDVIMTLLRSVSWLFREVLPTSREGQPNTTPVVYTPEARCIGTYEFEYSLILHKSDVVSDRTYKDAFNFNYPLICRDSGSNEWGNLPSVKSYIGINDDRIILSCLKKSRGDEALVLRIYNISMDKFEFVVDFGFQVKDVFRANMLEEILGEISVENNRALVAIGNKEILTLKIHLQR